MYDEFVAKLRSIVKKIRTGDPTRDTTDLGPMVDTESVERTMTWIDEAVRGGAKVLTGGKRKGRMLEPTILANVKTKMNVCNKEVFAPVAVLLKYKTFGQAVAEVNNSEFGLQAGIFTNRIKDIFHAFKFVETGGVIINDIPTYRADHMPYGGSKQSGVGREGPRYGIEDMTEPKILALNLK